LAAKPACKTCGHWSSSPAFGMDTMTGFCEIWEKLTSADYACDQYVERGAWQREQQAMYEEMEEEGEEGGDD